MAVVMLMTISLYLITKNKQGSEFKIKVKEKNQPYFKERDLRLHGTSYCHPDRMAVTNTHSILDLKIGNMYKLNHHS